MRVGCCGHVAGRGETPVSEKVLSLLLQNVESRGETGAREEGENRIEYNVAQFNCVLFRLDMRLVVMLVQYPPNGWD